MPQVMSKRKAKSQLTPVEQVLQVVFENRQSPLSDGFTRWKLEKNWQSIMSKEIANNTRPLFYERGTLIIEVSSSVWANELQYFLELMRDKINEHLGRHWVNKIKLVQKGFAIPTESEL